MVSFFNFIEFPLKIKKLTNTPKPIHNSEQNTNKTSYLCVEEFHTPHVLSLYNFIYDPTERIYVIENGNNIHPI